MISEQQELFVFMGLGQLGKRVIYLCCAAQGIPEELVSRL